MIYLVCPECDRRLERVYVKLVVEATTSLRVIPSREAGVEQTIASPMRTEERSPEASIISADMFTCPRCNMETPANDWGYIVTCSNCGDRLNTRPVRNVVELINQHICRDTMSLLCSDCWSHTSNEYCSECRFRDTCQHYDG